MAKGKPAAKGKPTPKRVIHIPEGMVLVPATPCEYGCDGGKRLVRHKRTGELHGCRCPCTYKDLPLKVVLQPENAGCMLAAVATITGKTYAEIRHLVTMGHDFSTEGTHGAVTDEIFAHLGYAVQERFRYDPRLEAQRPRWPLAPWADVHLCQVQNLPDTGMHAVVLLRDGRVLDPWWGVVHGLHRYPRVSSMTAVYKVAVAEPPDIVG